MYGDKIRMVRNMRGLTQEVVAETLGVKQNTYSKYENNQSKISDEQLKSLAKILGVSEDDLKTPGPVVMNFHESDNSGYHNNSTFYQNQDILKQFSIQLGEKDRQLLEKDKQIEKLLQILSRQK
jgi:transcriptional regulator with XRE-family HTH domain